eukprot:scaffold136604_cov64-Attheya_sp.AAC.1
MAHIWAEIKGHGFLLAVSGTICEMSSSSGHSSVKQWFGRESSVSLGGSSMRSHSFHRDSTRVPQSDMFGSRIWRDLTSELRVVVCGGLLDGQGSLIQQDNIFISNLVSFIHELKILTNNCEWCGELQCSSEL